MAFEIHSACERVPALTPKSFQELKQHIEAHGQQDPIVVWNDRIIDGRHRYQACLDLGIEPQFEELEGDQDDALTYIFTKLKNYRQMSKAQLAVWLAEIQPEISEEKWSAILHSPPVHHSHIKKAQELLQSDSEEDQQIIEQIKSGELKSLAPVLRKANPKLLLKNLLTQEFNRRLALTLMDITVEQLNDACDLDSPIYSRVLQTIFASTMPGAYASWNDRYATVAQALAAIKNDTFLGVVSLHVGALNSAGDYEPFIKDADLLKNLAPNDLAFLWLQARKIQSQRWMYLEQKPTLTESHRETQVFGLGHKEIKAFKKKLLEGVPLSKQRLRSFFKLLTSPILGCRIVSPDNASAIYSNVADHQHVLSL